MKRFVKNVCLVLAIVLIATTPVSAAGVVDPKASYFFESSSTYLWRVNSTTFEVWYDVTAMGRMDELGVSEISVQRSADGVNWTTMYTYTKSLYPQLVAENTFVHSGYITYTGSPGYYYRGVVTYYAKGSPGTGYMYRYTSSMLL